MLSERIINLKLNDIDKVALLKTLREDLHKSDCAEIEHTMSLVSSHSIVSS